MKLVAAFLLALASHILLTPIAYAAETCAANENTCTPKQLCDASTSMLNNKKVWSLDPVRAAHVALSKELGINCGVVEVVVATCETDAELCAISALCEQATQASGSTKVWSTAEDQAGHVRLANEYGLKCDVVEIQSNKICSTDSLTACTDKQICTLKQLNLLPKISKIYMEESMKRGLACDAVQAPLKRGCMYQSVGECTDKQICLELNRLEFTVYGKVYREESKKRGLTCGAALSSKKACSPDSLTVCSDIQICTYSSATFLQQNTKDIYKMEANKRSLPCLRETRDLPLCSGNGTRDNCFGTWTHPDGDQLIGSWKSDNLYGVGTIIANKNDQWKDDVRIGFSVNGNWSGNVLYIWHTGEARFERNWNDSESYNSNSTVNEVFPTLTRLFNNLSKQERIAIQSSLAKKGLYGSTIDGGWGRNTLIAIGRFSAEHLDSINLKATENVELVLDSIIEQSSLARTKMALPAVLDVVAKRDAEATRFVMNSDNMKYEYTSSSNLKRKQIQYALKQLGYYSSSIDGLWGDGTSSAVMDYVQSNGISGDSPTEVYSKILNAVDVPNSFEEPKPEVKEDEINAFGLSAIISNPSVPAAQAYAICQPQAQNAKRQASRASEIGSSSSIYCNSFGSRTTCNSGISGGVWGGIAAGLDAAMSGNGAYESVMSSCLAQYGWQE